MHCFFPRRFTVILLWFFARASQHTGNPGKSCSLPVFLDISHQKSSGVACGMCCEEGRAGGFMLGLLLLWISCQPASILFWMPASVRMMCTSRQDFPFGGHSSCWDVAMQVLIPWEGWWILEEGWICWFWSGHLASSPEVPQFSLWKCLSEHFSACCVSINLLYLQVTVPCKVLPLINFFQVWNHPLLLPCSLMWKDSS